MSLIANTIRETQERSLLQVDNGYSLDAIKRNRIDARLKKEKAFTILMPITHQSTS
jgi:hypothetical protein